MYSPFCQLCTSSVDSCPHQCCENAKRIHLHIKTCPATSDIACPTSHPGCQQARKLLIHYRKCKEMRTRQRRQARHAQQIKSCLICTLLARHDKGISENFSSLRISSPLPITPHKTNRRTKARSKSVQFDLTPGIKEKAKASYRPGAMPPPPPRSTLSRIVPLKNSYHPFRLKDGNRPRSGSLDERRLPSDMGNDPTVELELRATASDDPLQLKPVQRQLPFRKRSVSCSLLPNEKPADCDTIMEEWFILEYNKFCPVHVHNRVIEYTYSLFRTMNELV